VPQAPTDEAAARESRAAEPAITKNRIAGAVSALGLVGVASLAAAPIETLAPEPPEMAPLALRALSLVQPALLVVAGAFIGAGLSPQVGLDAPAIRRAVSGSSPLPVLRRQAAWGLCIGLPVAFLLLAYGAAVATVDDAVRTRLAVFTMPLATRVLYGGLTEEILARWGVMTLVVWLAWRTAGRPGRVGAWAYWVGIGVAAAIFGLGHLPVLLMVLQAPPAWLVASVIAANTAAGIAFGWLYWRAGLEAAILAHALAHVIAAAAQAFR
jgi:hypothetical protein